MNIFESGLLNSRRPEEMPYGVVAGVAEEGGREDDEHQQMYVQWRAGQGRDGSGHEEQ